MKWKSALAATVLALAGATGLATPALAAAHTTQDQLVGVVRQTGPTTAVVMARYTCTASSPEQVHLWISVKQVADRSADPILTTEGSSSKAVAWSQTHAGVPICDGQNHVTKFTVDQTEQGFGTLAKGEAWVQFCLFDATTTSAPVSSMRFLHVR